MLLASEPWSEHLPSGPPRSSGPLFVLNRQSDPERGGDFPGSFVWLGPDLPNRIWPLAIPEWISRGRR